MNEKIINSISNRNFGLHHGKMGLCLSYFIKAKISRNKEDKKTAKKLLNEVGENISKVEDYSFENGLLGIGWAIEWITQQKHMKIDTNVVLEELDDEIYKLIVYSKGENIGLSNGTLGRTLYLYRRMLSNHSNDFYRETSLLQSLGLAIDELHEELIGNEFGVLNQPLIGVEKDIHNTIGQVLLMMVKLYPLRYSYMVNEILNKTIFRIEELITDLQNVKDKTFGYACINSYFQASLLLKNKTWNKQIRELISKRNLNESKIFDYKPTFSKRGFILNKLYELSKSTKDYSWAEGWLLK